MTALQGSAAMIRAMAARSSKVKCRPTWRHDFDILGKGQGAKLLADLAGSAEQEEAHPSRAFLGEAAADAGVVRGQQRLPPGAILKVPFHGRVEARLEGMLRRPAEFGIQFGKIDRVAEIVPGRSGTKVISSRCDAPVGHCVR